MRLLERNPEEFFCGIEVLEASLRNRREALIDTALFGRNEKRLIEPLGSLPILPALTARQPRLVVSSKAFSRVPAAWMMALTKFASAAFCAESFTANPKNGCSLIGAA
ncbi:hypothetical protein ACFIOY_21230 [Bradyrhizobium sp. TZ2]